MSTGTRPDGGARGMSLDSLLEPTQREVEAELQTRLSELSELGSPPRLVEAMSYALLSGGKRVRPFLVLEGAAICGGARSAAMPAACAVELIHAFSLVQDDLPCMDDEGMRRGRPTCHRAFGEAIALLAADSLYALAFEMLAKAADDPRVGAERALAAILALTAAAGGAGMAAGQALDLTLTGEDLGEEVVKGVHARKTGSLIRASLRLGALFAGADAWQTDALEIAGTHLGILYQIVDDLVDLRSMPGDDPRLEGMNLARILGDGGALELADFHARAAHAALAPLGPAALTLRDMVDCIGERRTAGAVSRS